jgi:hypothetical protein
MLTLQQEQNSLSPEELRRLDELLGNARNFHYASIVLAGLSLVVSALDQTKEIPLPLGNISAPRLEATVVIYLMVIIFIMAADRLFLMARPWLNLDSRRPPFAWFALGSNRPQMAAFSFWLLLPVLMCAISSASTLQVQGDTTGFLLAFAGVLAALLPRVAYRYLNLVQERSDERGGRATFSIFLLYILRIVRQVIGTAFFIVPVFAVVPQWRPTALNIMGMLTVSFVFLVIIRWIGGHKFMYRRIDHYGVKYGFPAESKHYK